MGGSEDHRDDRIIASFRFGPSFRIFATLWWLMGPVPLVLLAVDALRNGDPVDLYVYLFFAAVPIPLWGLALWRGRIDITEQHVIVRRLRSPLFFVRNDTQITISSVGGTPVSRVSDGSGARSVYSVTAMRRGSRKLRQLAVHVSVMMHGKQIDPLR